jgi:hypothetical protein
MIGAGRVFRLWLISSFQHHRNRLVVPIKLCRAFLSTSIQIVARFCRLYFSNTSYSFTRLSCQGACLQGSNLPVTVNPYILVNCFSGYVPQIHPTIFVLCRAKANRALASIQPILEIAP